jgi:hypothetical protein
VLINTNPNPMGVSTYGGVPRKVFSLIFRPKAPISLMGAAKVMCEAPLFSVKTMTILGI